MEAELSRGILEPRLDKVIVYADVGFEVLAILS